jgi:tryptophanyl-tRNA synthetase
MMLNIGCLDCKKILLDNMYRELEPIQKRQRQLRDDREHVFGVLEQGREKAKQIAMRTMDEVYTKLGTKLYH